MRSNKRFTYDTTITPDYYVDYSTRLETILPIKYDITHTSAATQTSLGGTLRLYERRIEIKMQGVQPPHLAKTRRGLVSLDFEGKARKRMISALHEWRIPQHHKCYFLTLTYPADFPLSWEEWKADFEKFRRRLLARFPSVQGFWRLELQKRGAPHFHLVISLPKGQITNRKMYRLIRAFWAKIAHEYDVHQGKYATRVDVMDRQSAIYKYMSKYVSKPGSRPIDDDGVILQDDDAGGPQTMGRHWGKIGKPSREKIAEFDMLGLGAITELKSIVIGWLRGQGAYYAEYLGGTPPQMSWDCVGIPGLALLLIIDELRIGRGLLPHERARVLATL